MAIKITTSENITQQFNKMEKHIGKPHLTAPKTTYPQVSPETPGPVKQSAFAVSLM